MKRILTAILIVTAMVFADAPRNDNREKPLFMQGKIKIQLTESAHSSGLLKIDNESKAYSTTGFKSLDELNMKHSSTQMKNPFMEVKNKEMQKSLGLNRWLIMDIPETADVLSVVEDYKKDQNVEFACPEYLIYTTATPSDPMYTSQWGHNNTAQMLAWKTGDTYVHTGTAVGTVGFDARAQLGWDGSQGYGSSTVIIGIIDSGVDTAHEDINDVAGYDFGDNDTNPMDNSSAAGHGTCCAGVAAGIVNNAKGVAGVAGNCKIMPLKIADSAGSMSFTSITNAVNWGTDNGAHVLSMSLGANVSPGYDTASDAAMLYAYNSGVVVLAATANNNATNIYYPSNHANVVGVGAASNSSGRKRSSSTTVNTGNFKDPNGVTVDNEGWWGSNYGVATQDAANAVDFIAPCILTTTDITGTAGYQTGNYYTYFNGTSSACPYAAGFAALVVSRYPTYTPAQVISLMKSTCTDIVNVESVAGWDKYSGYGLINIGAALSSGTAPGVPTLVSPTNGSSTADLTPTFDWNDASGATSYTIQIDNTSNFSSPEYTNSPTVSTYTPAANLAVGTWYWRVLATNSYGSSAYTTGWSVILGTAPAVPTLALPANGSSTTDQTPTFDWNDVSGATSYTIQVDNNSDFSTPEATNSPAVSTYTPGANLAYGTYYWRVLATNAFGSSAYTTSWSVIIGTVPAAPTLLLPANASSTSDLTPTFDWSDVSGATSYTIQIDNTSNFSSPEYINSPTVSTYTPAANLAVGTWYWRVLTTNTFGSSAYTTGWSVILGNAPAVPTLLLPADASSTTDQTPTFDWNDVSGATTYTLLVDNDIAFGSPEINQSPTVSTYTPAANLTYATYYWKVMATNAFGSSVYSGSWSVIIGSVPVAPTLLLPANASSTSDLTPTFDWSDVSGATSYTIQIDNTSNFSSPEYTNSPTVSTYTPAANLAVGTWYWRVLTTNTFGSSAYTTGWSVILGNAPAVPTLISPADASLTTDQTPAFDWSDVSGATSYTIQADNNVDFSSPEVTNSPAVSTYTQGTNLAYGTYYWRVLATNAFGSSVYTASWSLVIGTVPGAPTLLSPSDLSSTMDQTPAFDWSDVSLATSYTILVDNNSNFSSPEINQSPAVSNFTPVSNLAEGTYYWKVLSTNGFGASSYSSAWSFTIAIPNITLSTTQVNTTAAPEGTDTDSFNINNTGTLNLDYSISKAYVAKGSKADITVESNDFTSGLGDYTNSGTATWTATAGQAVVSNGTTTNLTGILTSGSFDGTGCTSLTLTFNQVFTTAGLSTATVEYYNGTAWTQIYTAGASTSVSQSLALPVIAANMQLRFNCAVRKNSTDSWSIDNIVVSGPAVGPTYTWLTINSTLTGSVTPAGSNAINITCDAAGLAEGTYNANITVTSNDPDEPSKVLPVQFVVTAPPILPGTVTLVSPSDAANLYILNPSLDWGDAADATGYEVLADNNSDFSSPEVNTVTVSSSYNTSSLALGTYYWKARGTNVQGSGQYSSVWTFNLLPLSAPANVVTNVVVTDLAVSWDAVTGATSYDVYSSTDPYGTFTFVTNVVTNSYSTTASEVKLFWYIKARN